MDLLGLSSLLFLRGSHQTLSLESISGRGTSVSAEWWVASCQPHHLVLVRYGGGPSPLEDLDKSL